MIFLNKRLPSIDLLLEEGIQVKVNSENKTWDVKRILILNLMPQKAATEIQLLRLLGNSTKDCYVDFMYTRTHESKTTNVNYLTRYYKELHQVKNETYDGMIITGAPLEHMDFDEVDYWEELKEIMDYAKHKIKSTLFICWGAQAALYYYYGIPKRLYEKKIFGVFSHKVLNEKSPFIKGFDDVFLVPHSRYAGTFKEDVIKVKQLEILSESDEAGIYIVASKSKKQIFVSGHGEYDSLTLKEEYERDVKKGIPISLPENYFPHDNPDETPLIKWRAHGQLLFLNWLNQL